MIRVLIFSVGQRLEGDKKGIFMEFDSRAIVIRLDAISKSMDELTNNLNKKNVEKAVQTSDLLLHLIDIFWEYYTLNARSFPEEIYKHFKERVVELLEDIYIGLSAFQNSVLSPEITTSLMTKYNTSFQSTQEQLCLSKDLNSTAELENQYTLDPRVKNDRITALLESYSSNIGECPYYAPETQSKCLLEPRVIKVIDCEGRCFIKGLCCQMMSEIEEMRS